MKTKTIWILTWEDQTHEWWDRRWAAFDTRQEAREFKKDGMTNKAIYPAERAWKFHKVVLNLEKKAPAKKKKKVFVNCEDKLVQGYCMEFSCSLKDRCTLFLKTQDLTKSFWEK